LLLVAAALVAGLVVAEVLIDPLSWLASAATAGSVESELAIARELWQSQGITDYTVDVEGFIPLACAINATLTVERGELVAVESRGIPGLGMEDGVSVPLDEWDAPFCSYGDMIIPAMFARVESALGRIDWSRDTIRVRFDAQLGYVTEYRYLCCYRLGLLNPACSDCNVWFTASDLNPAADG